MPWLVFLLSAVAVVLAGTKLSEYGDEISELTGLGRLWIGVVFMAAATSLPEVFTTVSAAWLGAPNLAAGDLFGAVMTNMLTLGIIDLVHRQKRVWQQAALGHTLVASLAMALVGLAALFVTVKLNVALWGIGLDSSLLILVYVLGMRVVFRQEDVERRRREQERIVEALEAAEARTEGRKAELRRAAVGFAASALALLAAAPFLASSAREIADLTGIGTTLIGTTLVALTTSLPELVTSLAAVRLGAFDLAVGNLFGSNAFNMSAFFFADLAYRSGPLLGSVQGAHVATALFGILLMNVGLMGIIYRAEKRFLFIEPDSLLMIVGYTLGIWVLFRLAG
ncbi:MAG: sodium:calcium antiporter [Nitrospirota bacterium]